VTATYLGSVTIGGCMPGAVAVGAAGATGINATLPDLMAQLAGLLSWTPAPISLSVQIATLKAMITAIEAQIALQVPAPSLAMQLLKIQALIAELQGKIGGLELHLELIADFQTALGAAGVHLVAFEGELAAFGPEVGARLASVPGVGPLDGCNAVTLLTTVPETWAALASIFKVTP
jgi:hypothetical protein